MKQKIKITILVIVFLASITGVYSQEIKHFKQNINTFILKFDVTKNLANRVNIKEVLNNQLNIHSKDYELLSNSNVELTKDELGLTHDRFVQFYKGIKVEHTDIRVHYKNNSVVSVNGEYVNNIDLDINPVLREDEAITQAKGFVNAKKYGWEDPDENRWPQEITENKNATFFPRAELVICKNRQNPRDSTFHLAHKINIYAVEPLSHSYIYVDAKNGSILNNEPILRSINGNASTRYSGNRTISTSMSSPNYILKDDTRGNGIETKNKQHHNIPDASNLVSFSDNDNNWNEHSANKDNAALDAHWGMMMTYDYFFNVHGRNSYDGQGAKINNYVHFGSNYANAAWVTNFHVFVFGDGYNNVDALTCLDIVAHEFGHAICGNTAQLVYQNESGAIDEGLSDIWGACVKYYTDPSKNIWEMGREIILSGDTAFSSMSNPNLHRQPDTYGYPSAFWVEQSGCVPIAANDYCGVHTNSGVMNHWFYILVNGKNGTNDLGDPFNVKGIGIDKAAKIVYHTENQFWTTGSGFNYARDLSINTAAGLYQNYSSEVVAVTNAWYAVGVGDEFSCDDWMYIFAEDYTSNTTIAACNIELYEVTVANGAKLTLDVANNAIINGPFEVALGSQFEVK